MQEQKLVIGVVQILEHLKEGMTRDDIKEKYSLTAGDIKMLFSDDRLKGKKTAKKPSFILVDDVNTIENNSAAMSPEPVLDVKENEVFDNTTEENVAFVAETQEGVADPVAAVEEVEEVVAEEVVAEEAIVNEAPKDKW